ncbi:MAG: ferredoxin--NADP reductase [Cocleimonas sp.]
MATNWVTAKVIENRKLTDRHYSLIIDAELLPFKAGQFARLQIEAFNEDKGERGELEKFANPYSLINTPSEKYTEVYFNTVPDGKVSNGLAALQTGDTLEIAQPCVGFFVLSQVPKDVKNLWMLSTGTGIGPFLSMLKTNDAWEQFDKVVLVHAVPQANELCYAELIEQFKTKHPKQFTFISIVSRETHNSSLKGRIPALIADGSLEEKAALKINKEDSHIMLCGNSGMLKDTKLILKEQFSMDRHLNHKPGHVSAEQYY